MLKDFKIGHYTDEEKGTGVTVILAENGATGGVSVLGAAPATRETDLLKNDKTVQLINAVVLSGGSAFGLEASSGVMDWLFERGYGYNAGKYRVPIVAGASLYDLEYKSFAYPDKKAGYLAADSARAENFEKGNIGAGTGATVGKILGIKRSMKGGMGVASYQKDGLEVAFFVGVNALGDIVRDGKIIAGARLAKRIFVNSKFIYDKLVPKKLKNQNTTIGCLVTNAKLTKPQANELAEYAHKGYAITTAPDHTAFDGDAIFVLASGKKEVSLEALKEVAVNVVKDAVLSIF